MVDHHHPDYTESKPLNTELETLAPEMTAQHDAPSPESTSNEHAGVTLNEHTPAADNQHENASSPVSQEAQDQQHGQVESMSASAEDEGDFDSDFAAALASFDREQAAESAAAQNLTQEESVVHGTVVKITDKHVVVDIGLKSEGLIPLDQVVDVNGVPKFKPGDAVEVVVEREESEGGYLVSYEKALRHKVWDKLEAAANDKTPVKGMVLSRVKGGLTVDIGIKAFLPGSQVEVRPVRNLDG